MHGIRKTGRQQRWKIVRQIHPVNGALMEQPQPCAALAGTGEFRAIPAEQITRGRSLKAQAAGRGRGLRGMHGGGGAALFQRCGEILRIIFEKCRRIRAGNSLAISHPFGPEICRV